MKADNPGNRVRRLLGLGDYWYWIEGESLTADIPIRSLVYPLRYDVIVRRDFLVFYSERRDLYRADPTAFQTATRSHPYFQWVENVLIARFQPQAASDARAVDEIFSRRVAESAALYESMYRHGFDPSQPIVPFTGIEILPTATGKVTGAHYYMGDGCHRLACLMALGYETLPRDFIRVRCFRRLRPLDNTSMLEPHMPINWPPEWLEEELF